MKDPNSKFDSAMAAATAVLGIAPPTKGASILRKSQDQLMEELRILDPILRAQRDAVSAADLAVMNAIHALGTAAKAYDETLLRINLIRQDLGLEDVPELDEHQMREESRAQAADMRHDQAQEEAVFGDSGVA